jgi:hypothetical protein
MEQTQPLPRKKKCGTIRRSWTIRVLKGFFLLSFLFLVMPAVAQTRGAVIEDFSTFTANSEPQVSDSELGQKIPIPIVSLIFAVGLISLLRRR